MTKEKPVILVTNDDGIHAKGILTLAETVKEFGKVIVVSADRSYSAMSHAITVKDPLRIKEVEERNGIHFYQTNGTPADCVKLALHFILDEKPDYIVSGINHGTNSSTSVHYSGTLGAAREGCLNGVPSIGFSLLSYDPDADFSESKKVIRSVLSETIKNGLPSGTFLNVNIPESKKLAGIKHCRQGNGKWVEEFIEREDPRGQKYYWLTGHFKNLEPEAKDTDEYFLEQNFATVVPCKIDITDFETLNKEIKYAL
ncbi:5'/3'-nucleotidase SurE [Plebeiibacterium sediminum]|uniref:5'-nucleotidase SurE n=1 Tax=Plebeiibacterium sediminum TaxID=2992112 RepID=A0AAE3M617_9BACT|nr:5'/3'-nucleotidase SurE [Plebeiobacterium sediminum]MCW3787789.1 5'/3'-nucleotidase SurE [Plebeiobacterium sediminum]